MTFPGRLPGLLPAPVEAVPPGNLATLFPVLAGAVVGLTWAAALRGWMSQIAGTASRFAWWGTEGLVLVPGLLVGALLGWSAQLRRTGRGLNPRWLALAPLLFAAALADPAILRALLTTGQGGGSLAVVMIGLLGAVALRGRRTWARITAAVLAASSSVGVGLICFTVSPVTSAPPTSAPPTHAYGAWLAVWAVSLLALLALAAAIPYGPRGSPRASDHRSTARLIAIGGVAGIAWSSSLRGFMSEVAGPEAAVTWAGTFGWVLLPGAVCGGLLGWAEGRRRTGHTRGRRWFFCSPLLFAAVLLSDPRGLGDIFVDGIAAGAVGVPGLAMLGGYALAPRRSVVARLFCGAVFVAGLLIWVATATSVGGPHFALSTPYGLWATLLYLGLLSTLALAAALPWRPGPDPSEAVVR